MKTDVFPEDESFVEHMRKKAEFSSKGYFLSNFISPWEISLARFALEQNRLNFNEWGGYPRASKKRLVGYKTNFNRSMYKITCYEFRPVTFITYYSKGAVWNALSAHGVKQEKVGDILSSSDSYFIFIDSEIKFPSLPDATVNEVKNIPKELTEKIPGEAEGTVTSPRLDSILAVAFKPSRSKVQGLIENGGAMVNYRYALKPGKELSEGDIVSLRGFPRFKLSKSGDETKKGRIRVRIEFVD